MAMVGSGGPWCSTIDIAAQLAPPMRPNDAHPVLAIVSALDGDRECGVVIERIIKVYDGVRSNKD